MAFETTWYRSPPRTDVAVPSVAEKSQDSSSVTNMAVLDFPVSGFPWIHKTSVSPKQSQAVTSSVPRIQSQVLVAPFRFLRFSALLLSLGLVRKRSPRHFSSRFFLSSWQSVAMAESVRGFVPTDKHSIAALLSSGHRTFTNRATNAR